MISKQEIYTVSLGDPRYPERLKEIHDPPKLLYVCGILPNNNDWVIGIVGTRKPTEYGRAAAQKFSENLADGMAVIVSGCAVGIDAEAHRGALNAKGRTIAILGSGLDHDSFFPQENWHLAETIIKEGGALISEYPLGTPALPHNFLERNRIIAGLSEGVLIVEAKERSGALSTARLAMEENRDVFAIPGSIFSVTSVGPLRLLKEGAIPAISPNDILEFYGRDKKQKTENGIEDKMTQNIIEALNTPQSLDDLKILLDIEISEIQALISFLELRGKVIEVEPGKYQAI